MSVLRIKRLTAATAKEERWSDHYFRVKTPSKHQLFAQRQYNRHFKLPVVIDRARGGRVDLDSHQFLVKPDRPVSDILCYIRSAWKYDDGSTNLYFLYDDGEAVTPTELMGEAYRKHMCPVTHILRITFFEEATFGKG